MPVLVQPTYTSVSLAGSTYEAFICGSFHRMFSPPMTVFDRWKYLFVVIEES